MTRLADPASIARVVILLLLCFVVFYSVYYLSTFTDSQSEKQTTAIQGIIEKALVQCYALEGSYPMDVEYVQNYGVVLDHERYFYYYEWVGSNLRPTVMVIKR